MGSIGKTVDTMLGKERTDWEEGKVGTSWGSLA